MVHYIAALVSSKEVNLPDDMITLAELSGMSTKDSFITVWYPYVAQIEDF
jgi:hypothetical protein